MVKFFCLFFFIFFHNEKSVTENAGENREHTHEKPDHISCYTFYHIWKNNVSLKKNVNNTNPEVYKSNFSEKVAFTFSAVKNYHNGN